MTKLPLLSTPNVCLLSQAELADDRAVTLDVVLLQVVQQTSSVTNHLLQTAAAVEILLVSLEVLGQVSDAVGQDSNLYLGRTCVTLVGSVLLNDVEFCFFLHGFFTFQKIFIYVSLSNRWVKKLLNSLVSENRAHAYDSIIPHFFGFVNTFFKTFLLYLYIFIIYFRSRVPAGRKNHYFDEKKTKKNGRPMAPRSCFVFYAKKSFTVQPSTSARVGRKVMSG